MNQELLRIVENMARDKNIDKESVFVDLEAAMVSAARKHYGQENAEVVVQIDRATGDIVAFKDGKKIDIRTLGRISAQTAKQVMIQKLRTDERASIFAEFTQRKGQIITGIVARYEGGTLVINLNNRVEAFMPRNEQIAGQTYHPGERVRCLILDVKEVASQIKIILSRTHPDFVRKLFELEVPEVAERIIEMRALAREAGYRTKIAVTSLDQKVDPVGACVGIRGSRIKNIVDELGGEKIDIVRWDESSKMLIANALMPAKVSEIALCFEINRATVVVAEDQLSLAIGKHGQNVRLAARLTDWDIDILTPDEYNHEVEAMVNALKDVGCVDDILIDKMIALGLISLFDVHEVGMNPLVSELGVDEELARKIVEIAASKADKAATKAGRTQAQKVLEKEKPTNSE
ncbi:MAG TPA: transcription termination factor NusA [Sedimentisphaerales bacterium]|nr:transcription termination factor NusA [Sedimentisphaerales bacterium]